MTRKEAHAEADRRWGTPGVSDQDSYGTVVRRRNPARYIVGYTTRGARGAFHPMGTGQSWEAAFAEADR